MPARCRALPVTLPSVAAARSFVAEQLARWTLDDPDGSIVLLVSELVTNAVRHAGTDVVLTVAVAEGMVEVGVADADRRTAPHLRADALGTVARATAWQAEGGRGLFLVDAMADEWGTEHLADGKQVWFRLTADERWAHHTDCLCGGADLHDAVRLGSGRHALIVSAR